MLNFDWKKSFVLVLSTVKNIMCCLNLIYKKRKKKKFDIDANKGSIHF